MADSFEEVVRFSWDVGNPETASQKMLESLDKIDRKLDEVARTAKETFGNVSGSMTPALEGADLLIAKYTAIVALQQQMANAPRVSSPGGGTPVGAYNVTGTGSIQGPGGQFVSPNAVPDAVREMAASIRTAALAAAVNETTGAVRGIGGGYGGTMRFGQADWAAQNYPFASTALTTRPDMSWTSQGQAWPWGPAPAQNYLNAPGQTVIPPPPFPQLGPGSSAASNATINGSYYGGYFGQAYPPTSGGTGYTTAGAQQPLPASNWYSPPGPSSGGGTGGPQLISPNWPAGGPGGPAGFGPPSSGTGNWGSGALAPSQADVDRTTQFERTLGRIALYSAIFMGFRVASDVIHGMVEEMIRLEDVSTRVGFITGQSQGQTQYQFAQAAAQGISPQQAGPGILAAAQLGTSPQTQEDARRAAAVFGAEKYAEILDEMNEIQSRANVLGVTNVNILDFLAESYRTLNGTITDYTDALDVGIQTGAAFGVGAEEMGLVIERISRTSGESTKFVGNLVQSTLERLRTPKIQEELKDKFGITATDPQQQVLQIADRQAQFAATGQQDKIQEMMGVIQGGLAGPGRERQLPLFFEETAKAIRDTTTALAEFDDLYTGVMSTGTKKIELMTAAWRLFLQSVGDTKAFKDVIDSITEVLNRLTLANQANTAWEDRTPEQKQQILNQYTRETGLQTGIRKPGIEFSNDLNEPDVRITTRETPYVIPPTTATAEEREAMNKALLEYALRWINGIPSGSGQPDHIIGGQSGYRGNQLPELEDTTFGRIAPHFEFGGFNTYTKEQSQAMPFDKFEDLVRSYEKQISGLGGYKLDQRTEVYYDESTRTWRTMLADSNAIRFATEELRKMQQEQITGTFNVPDGGRSVAVLFNALTAGFRPDSFLNKGGGASLGDMTTAIKPSLDGMSGAASNMSSAAIAFLNAITATMGRPGESPYGGRNTIRNAYTGDNVVGRGEVERGAGYTSDSPTGADRWRRGQLPGYSPENPTQEQARTPLSERHIDPNRTRAMQRPGYFASPDEDYLPSDRNRGVPSHSQQWGRQSGTRGGGATASAVQPSMPININNRIMVNIDGRVLASYMNRRIYREFENIRNSNSNGPNTTGMVG